MADELELVETLMEDFGKFKTKSKKDLDDIKAIAEKALTSKELEEKHAEAKTWIDDLNKKVEEINNDIAAKGATVKQLQDELQEFKARRGRVYTPDGQEEETTKNLLKAGFAENFDKIKE